MESVRTKGGLLNIVTSYLRPQQLTPQGLANFVKGKMVNILGFVDRRVLVATT